MTERLVYASQIRSLESCRATSHLHRSLAHDESVECLSVRISAEFSHGIIVALALEPLTQPRTPLSVLEPK